MPRTLIALVIAAVCGTASVAADGSRKGHDPAATSAMQAFAMLLGRPLSESAAQGALVDNAEGRSSPPLDALSRHMGVSVTSAVLRLSDVKEMALPVLLWPRAGGRAVVVGAVGSSSALIFDGGVPSVVSNEMLAEFLSHSIGVFVGPERDRARIVAEDPVRITVCSGATGVQREDVVLKNVSQHPVSLSVGETSCSCADVELDVARLAPGERGSLSVWLRPPDWGASLHTVALKTDDPRCPRILVAFSLQARQSVTVMPSQLTIRAERGVPTSRTVVLLLPEGANVTKSSARHGFVSARVLDKQRARNGMEQVVVISVAPTAPAGPFADEVAFELEAAGTPRASVAIDGYVEADLAVRPREAFFGVVPAGSASQRTLVVESASGRAFALKSIEAKDARVRVAGEGGREAVRHEIRVDLEAKEQPGPTVRDRVKVTLTDGRTVEFGVFAMIGPAEEGPAKP